MKNKNNYDLPSCQHLILDNHNNNNNSSNSNRDHYDNDDDIQYKTKDIHVKVLNSYKSAEMILNIYHYKKFKMNTNNYY